MSLSRIPSPRPPVPGADASRPACAGCCSRPENLQVGTALARAQAYDAPFRHWLLENVLPSRFLDTLAALPEDRHGAIAAGRRETANGSRRFMNRALVAADPGAAALAEAFENCRTRRTLATLCGIDLGGALLRIEYAVDRDGFWLEPHTDIAAKRLTLLIFLSEGPDAEAWGTDLYDRDLMPVARVAARRNSGIMFVPGADTWHGFERRPISGVRRTLIVNYVDQGWRARDELVAG